MQPWSAKLRSWLPGLLTALVGVACVRLLAPQLSGRGQAVLIVFGYLLVPAGLGLIARQIHRGAVVNPVTLNDRI